MRKFLTHGITGIRLTILSLGLLAMPAPPAQGVADAPKAVPEPTVVGAKTGLIPRRALFDNPDKAGPQVLPANLRAGRVLYYSAIPTTIPSSGGSQDQLFWKSLRHSLLFALVQEGALDLQCNTLSAHD